MAMEAEATEEVAVDTVVEEETTEMAVVETTAMEEEEDSVAVEGPAAEAVTAKVVVMAVEAVWVWEVEVDWVRIYSKLIFKIRR